MARPFVVWTAVVSLSIRSSFNSFFDILSGKSDPFVVFNLNEQKVYKSQTKKKTLTPEWNEQFTVQVVSLFQCPDLER